MTENSERVGGAELGASWARRWGKNSLLPLGRWGSWVSFFISREEEIYRDGYRGIYPYRISKGGLLAQLPTYPMVEGGFRPNCGPTTGNYPQLPSFSRGGELCPYVSGNVCKLRRLG